MEIKFLLKKELYYLSVENNKFAFSHKPTPFLLKTNHRGECYIKHGKKYFSYGRLSSNKVLWRIFERDNIVMFKDISDDANVFCFDEISEFEMKKFDPKQKLGIVHWGGDTKIFASDYLIKGAHDIWNTGLRNLKIYAGPNSDDTYFTDYKSESVLQVIQQPNYKHVLEMGWDMIVLICHPRPKNSCKRYWRDDPRPEFFEDESKQLIDLCNELSNYKDTKFIISNWEGDCIINNKKNKDTYEKFGKWIEMRQSAISFAEVKNVFHALEINFVSQSVYGHRSVLTEVVPHVKTDFLSYSCYDCKNEDEFSRNIDMIQNISGNTPMIIGEFGIKVSSATEERTDDYFFGIINQIISRESIVAGFYWRIYENKLNEIGYGLYGDDGAITGIYMYLKYMT